MKRTLAALLTMGLAFGAHAMKLEVQGKTLFATGPVEDDIVQFRDALAQPQIDTIVFVNSPGGDLWTGMTIGRLIADREVHTVAAGYCVSACSIMFMGGKVRTFSDTFQPKQTYIGIHGPHSKTTGQVVPQHATQIYAFFKRMMGDGFNAEVMNTALFDMEDAGALLRVYDPQRLPKRITYHCKAAQMPRKDCTDFKELDALNLKVITSNALTPVELPPGFKVAPTVTGRELTTPLADATDFFAALSAQQCKTDSCRKLVTAYQANSQDKALAIPVGASGLGTASKRDTPLNAFWGAIFACNHVKGKPARLCEAQTVNGYDIRHFYTEGQASHADGLAKLSPPATSFMPMKSMAAP